MLHISVHVCFTYVQEFDCDIRNCDVKFYNMETIIKELSFDEEMVNKLESKKVDLDVLYVYLMEGKITMKEYLHLCGVDKTAA